MSTSFRDLSDNLKLNWNLTGAQGDAQVFEMPQPTASRSPGPCVFVLSLRGLIMSMNVTSSSFIAHSKLDQMPGTALALQWPTDLRADFTDALDRAGAGYQVSFPAAFACEERGFRVWSFDISPLYATGGKVDSGALPTQQISHLVCRAQDITKGWAVCLFPETLFPEALLNSDGPGAINQTRPPFARMSPRPASRPQPA